MITKFSKKYEDPLERLDKLHLTNALNPFENISGVYLTKLATEVKARVMLLLDVTLQKQSH